MDELLDEPSTKVGFTERYFGLSFKKSIIALFVVLISGIYLGIILFGNNSLEVLFELEEYEYFLREEVERLKKENASLQKKCFELEELDTTTN